MIVGQTWAELSATEPTGRHGATSRLSRRSTFVSELGRPVRRSNFSSRIWGAATTAAGLAPAPRFHDLRHSHVALLIAENVPMKAIQVRLGHASIVLTTDRYGHLLPETDEPSPRRSRASPRVTGQQFVRYRSASVSTRLRRFLVVGSAALAQSRACRRPSTRLQRERRTTPSP